MNRITIILLCIFFFCIQPVNAQQNHFIYIQSENRQPFYIKLDKKLLNSSVSGYLIIPKLRDGVYNLSVGFPKSEWPEQKMVCQVDNKDLGYLLKNFGEKGWGLFNLQTMEIVMADKNTGDGKAPGEPKADAFSTMLSTVVNDPSIKKSEPVKEEPKKPSAETKEKPQVVTAPIEMAPVAVKSVVTKAYTNKKVEGDEIVYVDASNGKEDSIRIFIPAAQDLPVQQIKEAGIEETPAADKQLATESKPVEETAVNNTQEEIKPAPSKKEKKKKEEKFLPIEIPPAEIKTDENKSSEPKHESNTDAAVNVPKKEEVTPAESAEKKLVIANSDCKNLATEEDFLKLRKKMAAESEEDGMVSLAKKSFKNRCFTTEQIKNLSTLFLKDLGKYNFFDLAYPYVSDSQNYSTLESQLSDSYYISRFKAMIRH